MDDGPDRVRRQFYSLSTVLKIALWLNFADTYPAFVAFVRDSLNTGSLRFTGPVLMPNGTIATKTCQIAGDIAVSYPAPTYPQVAFDLRVWDYTA